MYTRKKVGARTVCFFELRENGKGSEALRNNLLSERM